MVIGGRYEAEKEGTLPTRHKSWRPNFRVLCNHLDGGCGC